MTNSKHPYESIETFVAEKMSDAVWKPRDQYLIYLRATERLNISVERPMGDDGKFFGYSLYRYDILSEAGIDEANLDADKLALDIWEKLFQYTSVREMVAIRKHIDKYVNTWNDRRMAEGHPSYFEEAEYEAIGQNGTGTESQV